jgi:ketosteroid isomerase-like protein
MTLEEMEKRLRVVEDIEQIRQLHYRYLNCVNFTKWDEIMDCFAKDCVVDFAAPGHPIKGTAAIEKYFKGTVAKLHVGKEGDFVVHPLISVDGDKAKGNWVMYMMYFYPRTGQSLFWVQGIYDCEYIREDGQWKFSLLYWRERLGLPGGGAPRGLFD